MRTHPAQALERQAELIDAIQTPLYQGYTTVYVTSKRRTAAAGRVVSLPEDGDTPILPTDRERAAGFMNWHLAALRAAGTFHVAAEMTPLIGWMAGKLRDTDRLTAEHLPSQAGFVWLDEPLSLSDAHSKMIGIRGVLWQHGVSPEGLPGVRLVHYSDPESDLQSNLGRLVLDHMEFWPYGMRIGPPDLGGLVRREQDPDRWGTAVVDNHHRMLLAYFMLLGQKIVKSESEVVRAGSSFRRKRKMNVPDRVQVVALREVVYPKREGCTGAEVEWRHRWPVRPHPHLYWTGPGRTVPEVKWVGPYFKGPAGAPVVVTDKVFTLKR